MFSGVEPAIAAGDLELGLLAMRRPEYPLATLTSSVLKGTDKPGAHSVTFADDVRFDNIKGHPDQPNYATAHTIHDLDLRVLGRRLSNFSGPVWSRTLSHWVQGEQVLARDRPYYR